MIAPVAYVPDLGDIAAHYDDLDALYRAIWGTDVHHGYWITGKESAGEAAANLTRLVAERAVIRSGNRVCDFGCGYGATALALNRDYGAAVTGLTISTKQYSYAIRSAGGNAQVNFLLTDALQSNLPAEIFDAVIAVESTEHIPAKPRLMREARRVLRSGGRFVIAAWLASDRLANWERKHLLEPICMEGRLPGMASAREYTEMLGEASFRDIRFADLTQNVKKTWAICAARLIRRWLSDAALRRPARRSAIHQPNFRQNSFPHSFGLCNRSHALWRLLSHKVMSSHKQLSFRPTGEIFR